ncbi:MarR family winged helix-turn-helix transcriptional regulator [Deinococcus aquiradiocola]|uniref:MarR family transcriptional regulator n=1 Tax=Deinococcus aquiradiocola TaxID=393059 RepID=A0A917PDG0_9DEIO|nr:MarR family transcriptional regulator [Deinococcus aquiradiocola]GGJ71917.1 MarR family transcriptional regulator [Deinococcus aquiradiocola]
MNASAAPSSPVSPDPAAAGGQGTQAPIALSALLCFDVYATSRAVTRAYRPLLEPLGLTYPQFLVMLSLWEADADDAVTRPLTVGALGERLALDSGTLSPLLKRLEASGLLRRERSTHDEREVQVALSDEGRALQAKAADVPTQMTGLMGLNPRDVQRLQVSLRLLRSHLDQHDDD